MKSQRLFPQNLGKLLAPSLGEVRTMKRLILCSFLAILTMNPISPAQATEQESVFVAGTFEGLGGWHVLHKALDLDHVARATPVTPLFRKPSARVVASVLGASLATDGYIKMFDFVDGRKTSSVPYVSSYRFTKSIFGLDTGNAGGGTRAEASSHRAN